jgi:flagellar motor switch/type III secretory pathway protein FliN
MLRRKMAVRPFPYASLPKLTRRQQQLLRALRTCWEVGTAEQALKVASNLLGRELNVALGIGDSCSADELSARCATTAGVAVVIEQAHIARPLTCTLELSHRAAQQLVDLALGGDADALPATGIVPLDELSRGALAYVVARVLAALGGGWTLRNIVELSQLQAASVEDCIVWPIALELGSAQLHIRAYVPERVRVQSLPERSAILSLHGLRVTLLASAGRAQLPLSTLRELALGDVLVLDESALVRHRDGWRGNVSAGLLGSRNHLQCVIEEQGLRIEGYAPAKEFAMSTGHVHRAGDGETVESTPQAASTSHIASDAPIELQVEIARFSLSLGELQRLQAGDVLSTGRRIGEHVSLRVGGQAFAEAELVDVEGEVGVRLLRFSEAPK